MSIIPGKAHDTTNSDQSFVTALVVNGALLAIEIGAFVILKEKLDRIYSPRTFLPPPDKRSTELHKGPWKWLQQVLSLPTHDIIEKNGLDAYMFLRFLKMLIRTFLFFSIVTFIIIIPIDIAGLKSGNAGLDKLSWTNISGQKDQNRYVAHIIIVYILTFFVFYMIYREMLHFVHMRHLFLISKSHSRLPQARTVLITNVPDELASDHELRQFASFVPGGIDKIWLYRDTKALNNIFDQRQEACAKLEKASSQLLRLAMLEHHKKEKIRRKADKKMVKKDKGHEPDLEGRKSPNDSEGPLVTASASSELLNELVPTAKRPMHKLGLMGCIGEKVDTIEHCKNEVSRLNREIKEMRANMTPGKFLGSVFIRCNLQMGAHVLAQCVAYHEPLQMYGKFIEANPLDMVWANLDDGGLEMRSRYVISWFLTFVLIIGWAFPAAGIGSLSNLDLLCQQHPWLGSLCRAPNPVPGIIQGALPPILLAIMFILIPYILRALAWYECIPRHSLISISVYRRFFLFLLLHGFLIVTLTATVTKTLQNIISNPTQTVQQLAEQLPTASVFFLTYIVTQGLAGAGGALAQLVPLILHFVGKWLLGRTPRQAYAVTFLMPSAEFGTILPQLSLLATITFAYSVLNPLINLLALICFTMFYVAYKFLFTYVFDQPDWKETGGLYFPMAVSNLFVGLYIEQLCLAVLFFVKGGSDNQGNQSTKVLPIVEGALMVLLFVITILAHVFIRSGFNPITKHLPMSLAVKKLAKKYEKRKADGSVEIEESDELDLFRRDHVKLLRRRIKKFDTKLEILKDKVGAEIRESILKPKEGGGQADKKIEGLSSNEASNDSNKEKPQGESTAVHLEGAPELFRPPSKVSVKSGKSDKSSTKSKHASQHPVFAPAAPAEEDLDDDDDDDDPNERAFDHPATYVDQPWIWLPKDPLGLSELLVREFKEVGVEASDTGATMDAKGTVEVNRGPPDEDWSGGHDI